MKKAVPLCPGCGQPMECNEPHVYSLKTPESVLYICGYSCQDYRCGWSAPIGEGKTKAEARKDAFEKAIRRVKHADKQQTKRREV